MSTDAEVVKEGYIPYENPKSIPIPDKVEEPEKVPVKV